MNKKIASQLFMALLCLLPLVGMAQPGGQPDLVISNLRVIDPLFPNYDISYEYQITNIGEETASTNDVSIQAFISSDLVFSPDTDIAAGGRILDISQIQPGQTITQSFGATAQYNPVTHPYLTMKVDWGEALDETKEGNNFAWTNIVSPPQAPVLNEQIVQSQIILNYDLYTPASIIILQNLLSNLGGVETERCNCERGIAVWQFDSEEGARDALTEIDNRSESLETVADVDDNGSDGNELVSLLLRNPISGYELRPEQIPAARRQVLVYLVDSGLNTDYLPNSNNLLDPAPTYACTDVSGEGYNYENPPRINSDFDDENGHGTFGYRAITRGLSARIKVVPLKVFNKDGQGTLFGMICAIYHAIDNGADVINVSAGYRGDENKILKSAVKEARDAGIFIVTAAGNDEDDLDTASKPQYPAVYAKNFPNVISVASQNPATDKLGKCSNYGKQTVTMAAAGEKICGYDHKGDKVILSGTSIATFYVSRHLAIQLSQTSSTNPASTKNEFLGQQKSGCLTNKTKEGKCLKVNPVSCSIPFRQWLEQLLN